MNTGRKLIQRIIEFDNNWLSKRVCVEMLPDKSYEGYVVC